MKQPALIVAIIGLSLMRGQAFAQDNSSLVGKDYGCAVVMCMSNPAGATAEPVCKPPIDKLLKELAKGHWFPDCEGVDEHLVYDYFDPCPEGTSPAAAGSVIVTGVRNGGYVVATSAPKRSESKREGEFPTARACVGVPVGSVHIVGGDDNEGYAGVAFSSVVWLDAQPPRAIDVYGADGKLIKRARF